MFSPPSEWLKLMTPGMFSATPSSEGSLWLVGALGPTMQNTVMLPLACPVGVSSTTRIFTAPPQRLSSPRSTPSAGLKRQPQKLKLSSSVAVQVPPPRTLPAGSRLVNSPLACTDLGCTENEPSPVTTTRSPLGARPKLGASITSRKVPWVLPATAGVAVSANSAATATMSANRPFMLSPLLSATGRHARWAERLGVAAAPPLVVPLAHGTGARHQDVPVALRPWFDRWLLLQLTVTLGTGPSAVGSWTCGITSWREVRRADGWQRSGNWRPGRWVHAQKGSDPLIGWWPTPLLAPPWHPLWQLSHNPLRLLLVQGDCQCCIRAAIAYSG